MVLCNARSLPDIIAQGFYLCNGCPKSNSTTLNRIFSYAMLSGASKTIHKVFPMKYFFLCRRYSWDNIAQIKTLCSVVQEAPNNITLVKTLCNVVLEASDNNSQEKVLFNIDIKLF